MQILFDRSDEGAEKGLNIYDGECKFIRGSTEPNVGFRHLPLIGSVYFLNNYGVEKCSVNNLSDEVIEWGTYEILDKIFVSYIFGSRFSGCQFHRVSSLAGKKFIQRYLAFVEKKL